MWYCGPIWENIKCYNHFFIETQTKTIPVISVQWMFVIHISFSVFSPAWMVSLLLLHQKYTLDLALETARLKYFHVKWYTYILVWYSIFVQCPYEMNICLMIIWYDLYVLFLSCCINTVYLCIMHFFLYHCNSYFYS